MERHTEEKIRKHPVSNVIWVNADKVEANDYNMNVVAPRELELLAVSILEDGFTMPVVTFYDEEKDKYIIVDGFHRSYLVKNNKEVRESTGGKIPIVIIEKPLKERVASTIRHNRARGKHNVSGMSNAVFKMLDEGATDDEICKKLGMEAEELLRLKHITGFSKLFENVEYRKAWETKKMARLRREYMSKQDKEK